MLDIDEETARRIIDALAIAIDKKPASAKTFSPVPYEDLSDFENWGQDNNDSHKDTPRTGALLIAYVLFSGGSIPLRGIAMKKIYFRPDLWVMGALHKKNYVSVEDSSGEFRLTADGWALVAKTLESLAK